MQRVQQVAAAAAVVTAVFRHSFFHYRSITFIFFQDMKYFHGFFFSLSLSLSSCVVDVFNLSPLQKVIGFS